MYRINDFEHTPQTELNRPFASMWRCLFIVFIFASCQSTLSRSEREEDNYTPSDSLNRDSRDFLLINSNIVMGRYFEAMDSLCSLASASFDRSIDEYSLVHANRRIIDTLMAQDYYSAKSRGIFIEDQHQCVVLYTGDTVFVPSQFEMDSLKAMLGRILIDVNIPEFTLRIWSGDSLLYRCPVRVGRNDRRYLALAHREVSLQTPIGKGHIVRIERDPIYMNPVDGHRYTVTRRDDGRYTKLPRIPFLEPELDGRRPGSLIHPTTNRSTLGKAISNGCVGLSEADAWVVYYYAPIGTNVVFRYDLSITDESSDPAVLEDIYGLR